MINTATFAQAFFNLLLWFLIYIVYSPAYGGNRGISKDRERIGYLLIFVFCLFPFWGGDYFHYREDYYDFLQGAYLSLEPIYKWIILNMSCGSYTLFRIIIWGSALLLLINAYKKCSKDTSLILFVFGACYLPLFSYARVSLSISLILLGLAAIVTAKGRFRFISIVVGLSCIVCAEFFHRTAIIGILTGLSSFFLINARQKTIFLIVLFVPVVTIIMRYILEYAMSLDLGLNMFISSKHIETYLDGESRNILGSGWGERVGIIFTRGSLLLSALLYVRLVSNGKFTSLSSPERLYASYAFITILIGFLFLVDLGFNTYTLHYRTLNFAMPANAVFLAAVWRHKYHKKMTTFVLSTSMIGAIYSLIYSTYCSI